MGADLWCPYCHSYTGRIRDDGEFWCPECGGSGWLYYPAVEHGDPQPAEWSPCSLCNPRGENPPWYEGKRVTETASGTASAEDSPIPF